ncbi:MAG: hypothetical protein Q8L85_02440 [Alphaproteobacteria bacterium]|nr:hypothetical protein [Alphaproteobacteria bacterium]
MKQIIVMLFFLIAGLEIRNNQVYAAGNEQESAIVAINEDPQSELVVAEKTPIDKLSSIFRISQNTRPFLTPTVSKDEIFEIYHAIANSFQYLTTEDKPWDIPIPELYYLGIELVYTITAKDYRKREAIQKAKNFLETAKNGNLITYRWFLKFSGLCAAIATIGRQKIDLESDSNNIYSYQQALMNVFVASNYDPQAYFDAIDTIGSPITHEIGSLNAMAELFPEIVILPYPFDLSDTDIFLNFPGKTKHVWFAGVANKETTADGQRKDPHDFFYHDILHLAIIRQALSTNNIAFFYAQYLQYVKDFSYDYFEKNQQERVQLFFEALELTQNFLEEFLKDPNQGEDTKRMYSFFSFAIFHEFSMSLIGRLHLIINPDALLNIFKIAINPMLSSDYYGPLLPEKIKTALKLEIFQPVETLAVNFLNDLLSYTNAHHFSLFEELKKYTKRSFLPFPLINYYAVENFIVWNPSIYYTDYFEKTVKKHCQENNISIGEMDAFTFFYNRLSEFDSGNKIPRTMAFFYNFKGNPFKLDWEPIIYSMDVFIHKDLSFTKSKEEIAQKFKNDLPARQDGHPLPVLRYYGADMEPVIVE